MSKGRILSGMRPTGRLHIGHLSVLENWIKLQDEYECFFFVADWHALTTTFDHSQDISGNIRELVIDWLAAGLNPEKCVMFVQSKVHQHAELHLMFSMITPLSWLERVPTYKDQVQQHRSKGKDILNYGFLGYPVLQAADILVYRASAVPVGEDQLPHLELCREIARRFNHLYGPLFPEPRALLARENVLPGIDGRKMSKSYANDISISADRAEIRKKVNAMITDPGRIHKHDPGNPEVCVVHKYHEFYSISELNAIEDDCRGGKVGCVACKKMLAGKLEEIISPIRERRSEIERQAGLVDDVLAEGADRARKEAQKTMEQAREAVFGTW